MTFQSTSALVKDSCNAHIYCMLPYRIRFALSGFQSPILTGSQLVSLPAATKMFQFTACLSIPGHIDIFGSTLACSSPKLFAACHVYLKSKPGHPLNGVKTLTKFVFSVYSLLRVFHSNLYSYDICHCPHHPFGRRVDLLGKSS